MILESNEKQKSKAWMLPLNFLESHLVKWHLQGRLFMSPKLRNQKIWAKHLSSEPIFDESLESWSLLQKFTLPLIHKYGSSFHLEGIRKFGLDQEKVPDFESFQKLVYEESGWLLVPSQEELLLSGLHMDGAPLPRTAERKIILYSIRNLHEVQNKLQHFINERKTFNLKKVSPL